MTPNEYQKLAARTLLDKPPRSLTDEEIMILWNAVGIGGEAGEVLELVKKGIFHNHGWDKVKMKKELGDALWYIAGLATKAGLTMEEIMEANIEKLKERYPEGFNSKDSIERRDVESGL